MPQQFTTPLLLILMVAAFYFLMIRPQQKRAKAQRETLTSLAPGTRVLLANGFYATVATVHDTAVEVELAPGVTSFVVKQAIVQVVPIQADPAAAGELPVDDDLELDEEARTLGASDPADGRPADDDPRQERTPRTEA
ncbi:preprotein translocase subunit YajC [Auraticoccus monumenti]|uniref:Preprotein translocase subunit n=1 Tax=Auraticoccus monumenti TaxID=675864 RepID=A0A1G7B8B1_9ACTN|nr:preprotein translocase subunit YajC [Auraticoccus monumenti]SDE23202.1 Preprotein translocase subunit [Auraticoccus monumenti]